MTLSLLLSGCTVLSSLRDTVTVTIYYGSEKRAWLEPLVEQYNDARHETAEGSVIIIEAIPPGPPALPAFERQAAQI